MRSHNDSIDTTHTPPPLSFYNTFKMQTKKVLAYYFLKVPVYLHHSSQIKCHKEVTKDQLMIEGSDPDSDPYLSFGRPENLQIQIRIRNPALAPAF